MKKMILLAVFSVQSFAFAGRLYVGENVVRTLPNGHFLASISAVYPDGTADLTYPDLTTDKSVSLLQLSPPIFSVHKRFNK